MAAIKQLSETINVGVANAVFTPEGSNIPIYLGLTKDGATFTYETDWHSITADQTGTTPLEDVMIGEKATAKFNVLDTSKKHIAAIVPLASPVGDKDDPDAVTFGSRPGIRATHHSGRLVLHPVSRGDSDRSGDIIIYRTANTGNMELAFKLDSEWMIPCEFKAYPDTLRPPGDQLFRIGAEDAGNGEIYRRIIQFWITPSNPSAAISGTISFKANAMYEDGGTDDVTKQCVWVSSDDDIVSLSGLGTSIVTATGNQAGTAVIRAEFVGYSNSTVMTVG